MQQLGYCNDYDVSLWPSQAAAHTRPHTQICWPLAQTTSHCRRKERLEFLVAILADAADVREIEMKKTGGELVGTANEQSWGSPKVVLSQRLLLITAQRSLVRQRQKEKRNKDDQDDLLGSRNWRICYFGLHQILISFMTYMFVMLYFKSKFKTIVMMKIILVTTTV